TIQFVDASGEALPGVSEWAVSAGLEYANRLPGLDGGEVFGAVDAAWRSEWSSNPTPSRYMWVDASTIANLRAGYRADAGWTVTVWGRNVTDEDTFDLLAVQSASTGMIAGQPNEPRAIGVTWSLVF
ncbi:MAG: TonB-dependent receptor domain-containing protein, partial [Gammaproteobacteria bacterium]